MTRFSAETNVIDATERFAARGIRNEQSFDADECQILRIYGEGDKNTPTPEAKRARATLLSFLLEDESNGLSEQKRGEVRAMLELERTT